MRLERCDQPCLMNTRPPLMGKSPTSDCFNLGVAERESALLSFHHVSARPVSLGLC